MNQPGPTDQPNRTILVDQRLTGLLLGQTLQTTPAEIYRALIEVYRRLHDAFGTRDWTGNLHEVMKTLTDIRSRAR